MLDIIVRILFINAIQSRSSLGFNSIKAHKISNFTNNEGEILSPDFQKF